MAKAKHVQIACRYGDMILTETRVKRARMGMVQLSVARAVQIQGTMPLPTHDWLPVATACLQTHSALCRYSPSGRAPMVWPAFGFNRQELVDPGY